MRLESGCLRQLGQLGTTLEGAPPKPGGERVVDGKAGGSQRKSRGEARRAQGGREGGEKERTAIRGLREVGARE